nr:pseudouridine synthase [Corynebacterium uropygiale]
MTGANKASRSIGESISRPRALRNPLPARDGLNASRVRFPAGQPPLPAREWLARVIEGQHYRNPMDDTAALDARFSRGEVVDCFAQPIPPCRLMHPGEDLWFYRIPAEETPVPFDIRILHEDERLLVIDKPPFLATMPRGRHITETALVRLRRSTGNDDLIPAHRLDRLTSGVLVFIRRPQDRGAYQTLFASGGVHKQYEAVAPWRGALAEATSEEPILWSDRMEKTRGRMDARIVDGTPNARTLLRGVERLNPDEEAMLRHTYDTKEELARYVLEPLTGKTHQLRLHMCAAGVPILGDPVYPLVRPPEEHSSWEQPMQLLCSRMSFPDPINGDERVFRSSYFVPLAAE